MIRHRRRDEAELNAEFEKARPALFGAVLDTASAGLANLGSVRLTSLPRMAGFARWGVAVEKHLGFKEGTFLHAYERNREESICAAIEASPITNLLHDYLQHDADGVFRGTASDLLKELHRRAQAVEPLALKNPRFPKAPTQLSAEIARMEPALGKLGISVERSRTNTTRLIRLELDDADDADDVTGEDTVTTQGADFAPIVTE